VGDHRHRRQLPGAGRMVPPYGGILCHREAHIQVDEAGAPEFFTGGAKLLLVDGPGAKLTVDALEEARSRIRADVHQVQANALSITNATEYGLTYSAAETAALGELGQEPWARLPPRRRALRQCGGLDRGESPADLTWKAGVDALSFGFVKNGGLSAEALILFDRRWPTDQAAAQAVGAPAQQGPLPGRAAAGDGRGRRLADERPRANEAARRLAEAAGERLVYPVEANEVFLKVSAAKPRRCGAKASTSTTGASARRGW
jgi:threonine aldolase